MTQNAIAPKTNDPGPRSAIARRVGVACAIISALFCSAIVAGLAYDVWTHRGYHIAQADVLRQLKTELAQKPGDGNLKEQIRRVDLQIRQEHFGRMQFLSRGAMLLAAGVVMFLLSVWWSRRSSEWVPPLPTRDAGPESRSRFVNYASLMLLGLIGLVATATILLCRPKSVTMVEPTATLSLRWARFRGEGGSGIWTHDVPLPGVDSATVLWQSLVPLAGKNSVILWGNYAFVSGATDRMRKIYCYDARSGKLRWETELPPLPGQSEEPPDVMAGDEAGTGYAAATMCCDGQNVYAIFANGDLAAVDFNGQIVWAVNLGRPDNQYGLAASLLMAGKQLIVPFDQMFADMAAQKPTPKSKLLFVDVANGNILRSIPRDVPDSWTTPIVIQPPSGEPQIVTAAEPWVIAYSLTGEELWRVQCLSGDVAPSPVYADGVVYVAMEGAGTFAIRTDGRGDVTKTHILWQDVESPAPDIISPLATKDDLLTLTTQGRLQCFAAKTGKRVWEHEFDEMFYASPTLVGPGANRVLLISAKGTFYEVEFAQEFRIVRTANLGEACYTTPAFGEGRMYLRGRRNLFCIGRKEP